MHQTQNIRRNALRLLAYMDSPRFASILVDGFLGTTAPVYPASRRVVLTRAMMESARGVHIALAALPGVLGREPTQ
jgi:hypothetical protein